MTDDKYLHLWDITPRPIGEGERPQQYATYRIHIKESEEPVRTSEEDREYWPHH